MQNNSFCIVKMKRFKRILAGLLSLTLIFVLSGCSEKKGVLMGEDGQIMSYTEEDLPEGMYIKTGDKYYPLLNTGSSEMNYQWFTEYDNLIPEFTKNSSFILYSESEVPESFTFWKMIDFGYTVGIRFTQDTNTGELTFPGDSEMYCSYSPVGSYVLENTFGGSISNVRIKEVNGKEFKETMLTTDGFMKGLTKDAMYKFWYYQGTVYKSVNIKADTHVFIEDYDVSTSSYVELKDKFFEVTLPVNMENGYWYIDGLGMFKYSAAEEDMILEEEPSSDISEEELPIEESSEEQSENTTEETNTQEIENND